MYRFVLTALLIAAGSTAVSADDGYRARQQARDAAELTKALAGLSPEAPATCIDPRRISDTKRIGDTILYRVSKREVYRTDTGGGCFGLRRGDAIVTQSYNGRYCRGDIVRTVDLPANFSSGSCSFGDFVPYRAAPR